MYRQYAGTFGHRQHISGLGEAIASFHRVMDAYGATGDKLIDVFYKGAKMIRNSAQGNIKREVKGNLRRGIIAKKFDPGIPQKPGAFTAINYGVSPHAHLVEYGHVASGYYKHGPHVPAYPFFFPAVETNRVRIMMMIKKEMQSQIQRAAR